MYQIVLRIMTEVIKLPGIYFVKSNERKPFEYNIEKIKGFNIL